MTDYIKELIKLYYEMFDPEVVDTFISKDQRHLNNKTSEIERLFDKSSYERYNQIDPDVEPHLIKIRGCLKCILDNNLRITVRQQDFPGWITDITRCDIIIIGLEAKLEKPEMDIHIAYDHYPGGHEHPYLFKRYKELIDNIRERSYVTDIAKCTSSDFDKSRDYCFRTHFLKELEYLLNINPNFKIIFQGSNVEKFFLKSEYTEFISINYDFELKGKRSMLFKSGFLTYLNFKIPLIYFPHTSKNNNAEWKEIRELDQTNLDHIIKYLTNSGFREKRVK